MGRDGRSFAAQSGSRLAGLKSLARGPLGALMIAASPRHPVPASRASNRWRAARSAP